MSKGSKFQSLEPMTKKALSPIQKRKCERKVDEERGETKKVMIAATATW